MLSEAELSLDVLLDANREWFEYKIFQLRAFPSLENRKNTGNNLTDCFNANVMLANFLEVI